MFIRHAQIWRYGVGLLLSAMVAGAGPVIAQSKAAKGEWPAYGGDNRAGRYSPLDQINATNASKLRIAWRWESPDVAILKQQRDLQPGEFQVTPIMVGGVLYTSTAMSQVAAIDAATGKTLWVYDPETWRVKWPTIKGFQTRGVAHWRAGQDERIFFATGDSRLLALNAKTGKKIAQFGDNGEINLRTVGLYRVAKGSADLYGNTSPPIVCRNVVIVGSYIKDRSTTREMPPGDVRGFDARTGKLLWTFHTVPQAGEFGVETWLNDSWKYTGNANVWAPLSADDELGYVYLPISTPTNNFYGGERPGNGLFGESLVCLDAKTGQRIWHYQLVHHGIWDYDLPAAPNLLDLKVGGPRIKAVAQITKHGSCFVFDRVTGKPVWPIEERPVPQSKLPTEKTAATQPFQTKPPAFERQGATEADLIDYTPQLHAEALETFRKFVSGPLFTPIAEKPTILMPGVVGGANWGGAAVDPETGWLYVPSITHPTPLTLGKRRGESDFAYELTSGNVPLTGPRGLPLFKAPYGRITAYDLNKGEIVWVMPNGDGARQKVNEILRGLGQPNVDVGPLGTVGRAGPLLTKTLLFVGEGPHDPRAQPIFRAFDKATGKVVWTFKLAAHVMGVPMTYQVGGKQFIVVACGYREWPHELIALSLP